jgi:hypothetical protein
MSFKGEISKGMIKTYCIFDMKKDDSIKGVDIEINKDSITMDTEGNFTTLYNSKMCNELNKISEEHGYSDKFDYKSFPIVTINNVNGEITMSHNSIIIRSNNAIDGTNYEINENASMYGSLTNNKIILTFELQIEIINQ